MTQLWLPENEHSEDLAVGRALDHLDKAVEFRRALKALDERLDVVWAKKGARMVPQDERWYIIRRSDSGIGGMWCICAPDGGYADPGPEHIAALERQNPERTGNVAKRVRDGRAQREAMRAREKQERSERFQEGLLDRLDHIHDGRISVPRAIPPSKVVLPAGVEA